MDVRARELVAATGVDSVETDSVTALVPDDGAGGAFVPDVSLLGAGAGTVVSDAGGVGAGAVVSAVGTLAGEVTTGVSELCPGTDAEAGGLPAGGV